jgi:hypothetical protein
MNAASTLEANDDAVTVGVDLTTVRQQLARHYVQRLQSIARELYDCELFREANDLLRYLTVIEPSNPTHWYWLGRCFLALGDPMHAAHVFELGGRISHIRQFRLLAADAWQRAGYPERTKALVELEGVDR